MTIFDYIESRGWKVTSIGRWYTESMLPEANTLDMRQVIERLIEEDLK